MMREIDHAEARELLALDALDALSPEDRASLEAHVRGCDECTRERASLGETAALLALALPPSAMDADRSARVRARLMARAAADRGTAPGGAGGSDVRPSTPGTPVTPLRARERPPTGPGVVRTLAAAAIVILTAGFASWALGERQRNAELRRELAAQHDARHALEAQIAARDSTIADLVGPRVKIISVEQGPTHPSARMFWDQLTNRWTFVAHNMPAAAPGRSYQLWLITKDNRKVSAGTFAPEASGEARLAATYALGADSLLAIAVTVEPQGGSPQPTTTPILLGKAE
ncbi:MAG TPA: anti-sigma factor [Gemmatimonadaceae bacterium]|nr:anti-sigma factor [Gemmatimonadaceae bacterium]